MTDSTQGNLSSNTPEETKPTNGKIERPGSPGASTFGFETILGKLVVDTGLVTSAELNECTSLLQDADGNATGHTLADILVNHQLRLRFYQRNFLKTKIF